MEEYDDLDKGPDEHGTLNLSYNEFQTIPHDICNEYSQRLISLNLSYNNLTIMTEQICHLTLLKELNLSHNQLAFVDKALGQCIRLRKLDLSHNQITVFPAEIFQTCQFLDTVNINDNLLETIPFEVCHLNALEVLDVRNNELKHIPTELHTIQCLKNFQCNGNNDLKTIPVAMQSESNLALWTLKFHHVYTDQIANVDQQYKDLEHQVKCRMIEKLSVEQEAASLGREVNELERDRPRLYIRKKESCLLFLQRCRDKTYEQVIGTVTHWCQKVFKNREKEHSFSDEENR